MGCFKSEWNPIKCWSLHCTAHGISQINNFGGIFKHYNDKNYEVKIEMLHFCGCSKDHTFGKWYHINWWSRPFALKQNHRRCRYHRRLWIIKIHAYGWNDFWINQDIGIIKFFWIINAHTSIKNIELSKSLWSSNAFEWSKLIIQSVETI